MLDVLEEHPTASTLLHTAGACADNPPPNSNVSCQQQKEFNKVGPAACCLCWQAHPHLGWRFLEGPALGRPASPCFLLCYPSLHCAHCEGL